MCNPFLSRTFFSTTRCFGTRGSEPVWSVFLFGQSSSTVQNDAINNTMLWSVQITKNALKTLFPNRSSRQMKPATKLIMMSSSSSRTVILSPIIHRQTISSMTFHHQSTTWRPPTTKTRYGWLYQQYASKWGRIGRGVKTWHWNCGQTAVDRAKLNHCREIASRTWPNMNTFMRFAADRE